jgi:hypothetical protein
VPIKDKRGYRPTGRKPNYGGPWVPAAVVVSLLEPLIVELGVQGTADRLGVDQKRLNVYRKGWSHWVSFEVADRIIVDVLDDPALWYTVPELAEVYAQAR